VSVRQPKSSTQEKCPRCGKNTLHFVKSEVHHGRYDCLSCGRIGPRIKSPWTIERANAFTMPFGKYQGRSVGELALTPAGKDYLRWVAESVSENAGIAAAIALGLKTPDGMEVSS
jgi:uncharacterized protein (DUF3820 family)/predicted RNA-binding Zn-ribbon protein involved in translation (DUF1610 family)